MAKATTNARTTTKKGKSTGKASTKKAASSKTKVSPFGNFGKLISFSVSDKRILTFEEFKKENEARWKKHDLIGSKGKIQFLGPGLETVSLTITLDARHGVKPRTTLKAITNYLEQGKADYLVIGGKNVCKKKMVITKTSETWGEVWNKGELVRATLEMELQECA